MLNRLLKTITLFIVVIPQVVFADSKVRAEMDVAFQSCTGDGNFTPENSDAVSRRCEVSLGTLNTLYDTNTSDVNDVNWQLYNAGFIRLAIAYAKTVKEGGSLNADICENALDAEALWDAIELDGVANRAVLEEAKQNNQFFNFFVPPCKERYVVELKMPQVRGTVNQRLVVLGSK